MPSPDRPITRWLFQSISALTRRAAGDLDHLHALGGDWALDEGNGARGAADLLERSVVGVDDFRRARRLGAEHLADPVRSELRLGHLTQIAKNQVALASGRRADED